MEDFEELKALYLQLQGKKPKTKDDLYTMTEIRKIVESAQEIIRNNDVNHAAIDSFNEVLDRITYFENYGASSEFIENVIEVKERAIQAFQQFFDRAQGINV
ncbi:hypothetical protein SAMN04487764_1540 [Gillisia sp. Hel1_33_143]|uniref:hypothetical protein n=1 Tax=Gillisia sp. Hel1_33_143 TaxID=1336796 RepID=UPI000879DBCD|nr:hypothetical protein [Gillisia sp. Hel1_33_143]SDS13926.1 hypothetical protein SAMN04487764_1540 [Gillisia sp. Hel1_33_143]